MKNILSQLSDEDNIEELKDKNIDYENEISLYEKDNNQLEFKINELRNKKEIKLTNIDNSLLDLKCKYYEDINLMKNKANLLRV